MNITNAASAANPPNPEDFEVFQAATAAALRAVGGAPTHEVIFGRLWQSGPEQTEFPVVADEQILRGLADLQAAMLRHHADGLTPRFSNAAQTEFFSFLEQARCCALLGGDYIGARDNIANYWQRDPIIDFKNLSDSDPSNGLLNTIIVATRNTWLLPSSDLPSESWGPFGSTTTNQEREIVTRDNGPLPAQGKSVLENELSRLKGYLADQKQFARHAKQLIEQLWQATQILEKIDNQAPPKATSSSEEPPSPTDDKETLEAEAQEESEAPNGAQNAAEQTEFQAVESTGDDGLSLSAPEQSALREAALARYQIFTTQYDEVVTADKLADNKERQKLRRDLDTQLQPFKRLVQKLAAALQRELQSFEPVGWQRGLEDGLLDLQRISRVYAHRFGAAQVYKQPQMGLARDSVVTLLLDNSGSMRGRPIMITALCADILAQTLERCGVRVEILGYTTRAWKGGQAHKEWIDAGRRSHPGRLNELRHIVYKAADQNWRQTRLNIGVLLKEGLLKENIDGEALLWAYRRLAKRHEKRRILMVISDGAPVDDATLSANRPDYLEEHLHDTINWIEAQHRVQLVAIGIGHDVTRYYPRATVIKDVDSLAETMLRELGKLLKTS